MCRIRVCLSVRPVALWYSACSDRCLRRFWVGWPAIVLCWLSLFRAVALRVFCSRHPCCSLLSFVVGSPVSCLSCSCCCRPGSLCLSSVASPLSGCTRRASSRPSFVLTFQLAAGTCVSRVVRCLPGWSSRPCSRRLSLVCGILAVSYVFACRALFSCWSVVLVRRAVWCCLVWLVG